MTKQATILTMLFLLASPAALACTPGVGGGPAGDPQCMAPILQQNSLYNNSNNTYVEPAPVYRPPPPPPTHDCVASEGGETCFDTRPGRIGSSFSTNAAGDFDGPMVDSYPDGTPPKNHQLPQRRGRRKHRVLPGRHHRKRHAPPKRRNTRYRQALPPKRHTGIRHHLLQR